MQIPNADRAVIEPVKLDTCCRAPTLLAASKPHSLRALGYSAEEWNRLEADLRAQHLPQDATPTNATVYGQKYEIRATLVGPANRTAAIVSVWIVRTGEDGPRFVTAYPEA